MSRVRLSLRPLWLALPVLFIAFFLVANSRVHHVASVPAPGHATSPRAADRGGRLVIVILDSLRRASLEQPGLMPGLLALARSPAASVLDVHTCASNFSLPCVQTIFSGRESPMASGIEEFSGYGPNGRNLLEAATASGLKVGVIGNKMVDILYGRHARQVFSVEAMNLQALPADLRVIAEAERWLKEGTNDVVLLHTAGTDHVTHYSLPGTRDYIEHFRTVDRAVTNLAGLLDLEKDSLVVMGDHGHDNDGHHMRHSLAIFAGRRYLDLFRHVDFGGREIEQKDLLYLLSYPDLLPMSADYEGRFFALRPGQPSSGHLGAFLDVQRRQLLASLPDGGGVAERAVAARMDPRWRPGNERARADLEAALPLLACLFLWLTWTYGAAGSSRMSAWPAIGAGGLALVTWCVQRAALAPPLLLAVVPLLAAAWLAHRRGASRLAVLLAGLIAAAAATAAIEPAWRSFFHSRDEFHWGIPVFYLVMLAAGGLAAFARGRGARGWAWGTQLAAFVGLPAGVYYYQFNENPLRAYLIPGALWLAWRAATIGHRAWHRPRRGTGGAQYRSTPVVASALAGIRAWWRTALAMAVAALLLFPQDAGGWQWHSWIAVKLRTVPAGWSLAIYGLIGAWLVSLLDGWRRRVPLAVALLVLPVFVTEWAGLEIQRLAAAFVVVLFVGAWLAAPRAPVSRLGRSRAERTAGMDDEAEGLMLAAASVAVVLATCEGLAVEHIDFSFALGWTTGLHTDAARFMVVAPLVALKYAAPVLVMLAIHRLVRGPAATERAISFTFQFLALKMLALLLQVLVGALDTGEKFFELAQADFLFMACLVIVIALWTVALWTADGLAWLAGLTPRAVAARSAADQDAVAAQ